MHFSTELIANNKSFLDERFTNLCVEELHRLFKSVTKFINKKLVHQVTEITRWLIVTLVPVKQTPAADDFEVFVLVQLNVLCIFVFSTFFIATQVLGWIVSLWPPRYAEVLLKFLNLSPLHE